ncbi:MAG: hypothetical protein JWO19_4444, partial [Bryobacterales bacterium]|nr:hypothetical protein [Bryobacterales bacterium]
MQGFWWSGTSAVQAVGKSNGKANGNATHSGVLVNDLYVAIERDYLINKKRTLRNVKGAWRKHLSGVFGS